MSWRAWLGFTGFAAGLVLITEGQWLAAALTGTGVMTVIVLAPFAAAVAVKVRAGLAELLDIWDAEVAKKQRPPEPEPVPPPFASVSVSDGDRYLCARCGGPGETSWDDATARAARHAGVCSGCFSSLLGQLQECRSSDEDETMRVAARD